MVRQQDINNVIVKGSVEGKNPKMDTREHTCPTEGHIHPIIETMEINGAF